MLIAFDVRPILAKHEFSPLRKWEKSVAFLFCVSHILRSKRFFKENNTEYNF